MVKDLEPFMDQPLGNEEDEEDDDDDILLEADEIDFFCQIMDDGGKCQRKGQCISYLFNEGRYDVCEGLVFEDSDCIEDKAVLFVGEDN